MADTGSDERGRGNPPASPFVLTADDEAQIRHAARDTLSWSFARLVEERVLPRSRHRPWIRKAYDYFGDAVERSEGPLAQTLQTALPKRFDLRHRSIDLPWYASGLLEAAVAAATLADEPYAPSLPR